MQENKKKYFPLLITAVFLHLFALFCSVYKENYQRFYRCWDINYWLSFCSWWCVQASLVTIIYLIYKLFEKSKEEKYFDKVFDLMVINANIISIGIFTISAILYFGSQKKIQTLPLPKNDKPIHIFLIGDIMSNNFWWFYGIIWHYLAPILTIVYFIWRNISLAKTYFERRTLFLYSFLHPLFYCAFVFIRPSIPGSENFPFGSSKNPSKYPYFFFDWISSNDFKHIFWALAVIIFIIFWLVIFWFSTLFFWWYSNHHKLENTFQEKSKKNIFKKI